MGYTRNIRIQKMQSLAGAMCGSATFRIATSGTPHVLVTHKGTTYSVNYFVGTKGRVSTYRVFWPYPSRGATQKKRDLPTEQAVIKFFDTIAMR